MPRVFIIFFLYFTRTQEIVWHGYGKMSPDPDNQYRQKIQTQYNIIKERNNTLILVCFADAGDICCMVCCII